MSQVPAPPAPRLPVNMMANVALIGGLFFAPVGFVCGILALRSTPKTDTTGRTLAIIAIVLSTIEILVFVAFAIFVGFATTNVNGVVHTLNNQSLACQNMTPPSCLSGFPSTP
jgi:hypothetical protein